MSILDWIAIGIVISWFLCSPRAGVIEEASDNAAGKDRDGAIAQTDEGNSETEECETVEERQTEKPATTWRQTQIVWGAIGALAIFILAFR